MASTSLYGQQAKLPPELKIGGKFMQDSLKIAEPVVYKLVLVHPAGTQAVFPDSGFNYSPFELLQKTYYPTVTDSLTSTDSVSYSLQTFNIADTLILGLPVYYIQSGDSVPVYPQPDTIYLQKSIRQPTPTDALKAEMEFQKLEPRFNYPYWIIGGIVVGVFLFLVNRFLGKPVQKYIRLLLLLRRHKAFLVSFDRLVNQTIRDKSAKRMEQSLNVWKKHIEKVDGRPFSTFTTKEMVQAIPEEELKITLQTIDRCVYGGQNDLIRLGVFDELKRQSELFYKRKREEIRNA
jgi:hypothetical protein